MQNTREVSVLRFKKIKDENVTTKANHRALLNKDEVFTNFLIYAFEEGSRFVTINLDNPKNNLTLGKIAIIEGDRFGVISEIDGSICYFKFRIAKGALTTIQTKVAKSKEVTESKRLEIIETPDNWNDAL